MPGSLGQQVIYLANLISGIFYPPFICFKIKAKLCLRITNVDWTTYIRYILYPHVNVVFFCFSLFLLSKGKKGLFGPLGETGTIGAEVKLGQWAEKLWTLNYLVCNMYIIFWGWGMLDEDVRCKVDEDINYAVYYQKLPFFDRDCLEKGVRRETRECGARG